MRARAAGITAALALTAAIGAPAAEAAPTQLGGGKVPNVAVDGAGTAHIVWVNGNGSTLTYCRLPRGATACAKTTSISTGGQTTERAYIAVDGMTVRVFANLYGFPEAPFARNLLFTSGDTGDSFGPPLNIAKLSAVHDAAFGPGASVSLVGIDGTGGPMAFQNATLDGGQIANAASPLAADPFVYSGTVGFSGANPVIVYNDRNAPAQGQVRSYDGSGPLNDATNWTAPQNLGDTEYSELAEGPTGLFLITRTNTGLVVRKYEGSTFGAATALPNGQRTAQLDMTQDGGGRLHAVWERIAADGTHLEYAVSDNGTTWQQGSEAIVAESIAQPRVSTAPDHIGVAVYQGNGETIKFEPVGPVPVQAAAPAPTPQPKPVVPATPALYKGKTKGVKATDKSGSYTFGVPKSCVQPGQKFKVTMKWKRKKRKGALYVKLRRTDFYLGTKRTRIDKKAPFTHTFTVKVTQKRGSTIKLRARAFIKVKRGKEPKKSIRASIKVCAS